ncbi:peptidase inhibitor 16-like [Limanda limanda]|uniref:peptidase inhibitor 16-like n=1 Tax=Limanda limanda TaxID=27771 RepID=UPI0029C867C7|nr:peptidase inhibitor 16-like [Limanda limanda]
MHQRSISELQGTSTQQGASTQQGVSTRRTTPAGGSRWRGGAAPLWAWWLLLSTFLVPGAWSFLSEEQEELLVELHNHYRGQVSPSASAMMPLRWDPSLKLIAEGYAAKCVWNHNPELEETGENLFAGTGPLDLREALEKWFLEHLDYSFHNNSCDEDKMCGHYTQMVWADTHRVGCAFHLCNNMEGLEWERVSYLVCNYYPAGNYEDQRPYVEGDWCSSCPENLQKCENNLCVAEEEEEEDEDVEDGTDWMTRNSGSVSSPSLLLASLTGILSLRL